MAALTRTAATMAQFTRRFVGAMVLDPMTFEDIESDRHAGSQAGVAILLACLAGGFGLAGSVELTWQGFAAGVAFAVGAWAVWAMLITTIGTLVVPEQQTSSRPAELFRTMGFAAAPGVLFAFAAMRAAAPFVWVVVSIWMIAATVLAVRQALDYRSLARAVAVCVAAWLATFGIVAVAGMLLSRPVS